MISYDFINDSDAILRIIIEPESIEHDLNPKELVTISLSGDSPAFACRQFIDSRVVRSVSFWPDKGQIAISYKGRDILELH